MIIVLFFTEIWPPAISIIYKDYILTTGQFMTLPWDKW